MGGYGSGHWGGHNKKVQVEECRKLTIYFFKPHLYSGNSGVVRWSRGGVENGKIGYVVSGESQPTTLRLQYTINPRTENAIEMDYPVHLTTTSLPWGGSRYWFVCPLDGCGRRVGCLYLPRGGKYFGCRHCYDLTYESQQEGNFSKWVFAKMAMQLAGDYPGITWKDVRVMWDDKPTRNLSLIYRNRALERFLMYDRHQGYLSAEELCQQSGITSENLKKLEEARLLVPDTKDGRYRPKLSGWGKKLAFLIGDGWGIEEIRQWSKERWKSGNPREFPPARSTYYK